MGSGWVRIEFLAAAGIVDTLDGADGRDGAITTLALLLVELAVLVAGFGFTNLNAGGILGPIGVGEFPVAADVVTVEPMPFHTFLIIFLADARNPKRGVFSSEWYVNRREKYWRELTHCFYRYPWKLCLS